MKLQNLFLLLFLLFLSPIFGQNTAVDLSSPYQSVNTHLHFLQSDFYAPDSSAMAFSLNDQKEARQLATKLKQIFDGKGLFVKMSTISQEENHIDSLGNAIFVLFPKKLPEVYLEKKEGNWYYSAETVESIEYLHNQVYPFGTDFLLKLSPRFGQQKVLGLALWQYFGILILIFLAFILHKLLTFALKLIFQAVSATRFGKINTQSATIWKISRMASLVLITSLLSTLLPVLHLPIKIAGFSFTALSIFKTVFIVFLIVRIIDLLFFYISRLAKATKNTLDDQLLPILKKVTKAIFIILGIIQVLSLMKVNVTALIAGVSIGGLAIALAAQDTVKNLIGSMVIFIDAPFQIGDSVKIGTVAGTVEEVGFRSTRLRTSDTSLISIPNGKVADMVINNLGVRKFRRFQMTLGLTYDSPPELIELFVEGLRKIIEGHPDTFSDNYQVHLNGLADSSLNVLFHSYLTVESWGEELRVKQEVLLAILRLAQTLGIRFAFPSSTLYVEDFPEKKAKQLYNETQDKNRKKLDDFMAMFMSNRKK